MFTILSARMVWLGFRAYNLSPPKGVGAGAQDTTRKSRSIEVDPDRYATEIQYLETLMSEQKLFLNPELNLRHFAQIANLPQRSVSKAINVGKGCNFQAFVNHYRIAEFQRRMGTPEAGQLTLLAHAYASGFPSKSTFNSVFKRTTGITPRQYMRIHQNNIGAKGPET